MMVHAGDCANDSRLCYGPLDGSTSAVPIGPAYYDYQVRKGYEFSPDGTKVILFLTDKSVLIDLATGEWQDLDVAGDWVAWQRLSQS
jgi:hypothetical protein